MDKARNLRGLAAEGTGPAGVLDEAAPPLLSAMGTGNRSAAGQRPVLGPVGQRPLPRLPSQLPMSVASGRPGQGSDGARPPTAAPKASLRRLAGSPMMGRRETRAGGRAGVFGCAFCSVPWSVSAGGSAAGCIHPFACPGRGPGTHGAGPRQGGQAGSIKTTPAPP
jgi:hypothetical protein